MKQADKPRRRRLQPSSGQTPAQQAGLKKASENMRLRARITRKWKDRAMAAGMFGDWETAKRLALGAGHMDEYQVKAYRSYVTADSSKNRKTPEFKENHRRRIVQRGINTGKPRKRKSLPAEAQGRITVTAMQLAGATKTLQKAYGRRLEILNEITMQELQNADEPTALERRMDEIPEDTLIEKYHPAPPPAPPGPQRSPQPGDLTREQIERVELLIEAAEYKRTHKREFVPAFYDWQQDFCNASAPQVLLMAANRTGKTYTAGYRVACHLTGQYPDTWEGIVMDHPVLSLVAGVDNTQLKRVVQRELFGEVEDRQFSGGWVHRDEIKEVIWHPQVSGLAAEVKVASAYGTSNVSLRAYTQAKTGTKTLSFAGTNFDLVWVDECPPDELVGQITVRTAMGRRGKGGVILYTMTPELGVTELINTFTNDPGPGQLMIGPIAWDRCPHLSPEVMAQILDGIPEHEKDMRMKGIPFFGSGLVYAVSESRIFIDPIPIPDYWRVLRAMDLGTRHPTAIAWLAHDTERDTVYLVKDYAQSNQPAAVHAAAANSMWADSPMVFPPDVDTTEKGSGETVRHFYEKAGIRNALDFRNPDGSRSVEAGILELQERMSQGRFKAFRTCQNFQKERRLYHRDERGKLVKKNDDLLDAVRYGVQMLRYALPVSHSFRRKPKVKRAMARRGF